MTPEAAERNYVEISVDPSIYRRPDVMARLGGLGVGETLDLAAHLEPNALQILVDALLPGQYLWQTEYGPNNERIVRVTRL
jgi:uncharacterized protein (DUF2249 family)